MEELNRLVQQASNANENEVVKIILSALENPNIFFFSELLSCPSVQKLETSLSKNHVEKLRLFSYGTYIDFKANEAHFGPLSSNQQKKLRQLTIVSLATKQKIIPYDLLLQHLDMTEVRELEDLFIDSIYQGLLRGKLDQKDKQLEIEFAVGRDLRPGQLLEMVSFLNQWCQHSDGILVAIEDQVKYANTLLEVNRAHKNDFDKLVENMKTNLKTTMSDSAHLVDTPGVYSEKKIGKKRGKGNDM
eukprot:TRINITY_DN2813_c0_g1_i1.p1 TRINITY_DN2813_c0_g1~~TRINITY_DN2813_c0_g1_i1.p1  ORF type:complete len:245 (-),score=45.99 TRINITY_DN2813_c0_g1_i1:55-789(-)